VSKAKLKARLAERKALVVPGAPNAMTARIVADLGFEAVYVTGAGVTNFELGAPDLGLITLTELAETVSRMRDATELPLIVDADTGFGNAVNVVRTVRVLERAGADAIQLEDQDFPKKCGHFSGKAVIPLPEMVQKIRAAVDARRDSDLQIIARTDARAVEGMDSALERAVAFIAAGADATFVEAPESKAEMARIGKLMAPQVANMVFGGKTPMTAQAELAAMGYGMVIYANTALQAAVHGMQAALGALKRDGDLSKAEGLLASFAERQRLVDKPAYDALERKYKT
jgi:2-methylisocitrate lyase-like PEP mutase family enzyme